MAKDYIDEFGPNAGYVAELETLYHSHDTLVPQTWRKVFENSNGHQNGSTNGHAVATESSPPPSINATQATAQKITETLLELFRRDGVFVAQTNPLKFRPESNQSREELTATIELAERYSSETVTLTLGGEKTEGSLKNVLDVLQARYAGSLSVECIHLRNRELRTWLFDRIEQGAPPRSFEQKKESLKAVFRGEIFDAELHTNFLGAKRFSLNGADAFSAMTAALTDSASERNVNTIVMGMAHRGRLSSLAFFAGKPLSEIAAEFKDTTQATAVGSGDVKYHMGFTSERVLENGRSIKCHIPPNPSHLEFVDPVVHGIVRAIQDVNPGSERREVLPVLVHGDASFAGQGIVAEVMAYAGLKGYETQGTIHIILNNQVGFTTDYDEGHSDAFCSDVARGFEIPVLHVNGEDVEATIFATQLALDYRQTFGRDIVIDLVCYRRFGHNEGDDPTFTQPLMYKEIVTHRSVGTLYGDALVKSALLSQQELDDVKSLVSDEVKERLQASPRLAGLSSDADMFVPTVSYHNGPSIDEAILREIAQGLIDFPPGFKVHTKLHAILTKRSESLNAARSIDWGFAEALAFGTLLNTGTSIRLSGQDCGRGTFSHRHAELHDSETGARYYPLQRSEKDAATFEVYNSLLSEAAVLGFEFGYAHQHENALVLWEAQFGDFCNGAQPIIDQFIAASEAKWNQRSNVTLLLPHGFEGQGPEHSSARLERFLQLAANDNMRVTQPSNAAQYFHLVRSQVYLKVKKPLIVLTPKSLLRSADASCSLKDLTSGSFKEIFVENIKAKKKGMTVIACSGKVYYDLKKWVGDLDDIVLIRFEQLYPFPYLALDQELSGYTVQQVLWVQDEPQNMGAFNYIAHTLEQHFSAPLYFVGRDASASPATGSPKFHSYELEQMKAYLYRRLNEVGED